MLVSAPDSIAAADGTPRREIVLFFRRFADANDAVDRNSVPRYEKPEQLTTERAELAGRHSEA